MRCEDPGATWRKMASCVSFFSRSVSVARGMPSAERKASKASRMIRKAQASETMSSVRATEQLRSVLATFVRPAAAFGFGLAEDFAV